MAEEQVGTILAIAVRTVKDGPMREIQRAEAAVDGGLAGDLASSPERGITFIAAGQWREATTLLKVDLPWHTRRANVLIEAGSLAHLIGKTVVLGEVRVAIKDETRPCGLMDQLHAGLKDALKPERRGGVHGQVLAGGAFSVGDAVMLAD